MSQEVLLQNEKTVERSTTARRAERGGLGGTGSTPYIQSTYGNGVLLTLCVNTYSELLHSEVRAVECYAHLYARPRLRF